MFNWIYNRYTPEQICDIIDSIEKKRQERRKNGSTMSSTFAQEFKKAILEGFIVVDIPAPL